MPQNVYTPSKRHSDTLDYLSYALIHKHQHTCGVFIIFHERWSNTREQQRKGQKTTNVHHTFSTFECERFPAYHFPWYSHRTSHIIDLYSMWNSQIKIVYLRSRHQTVIILQLDLAIEPIMLCESYQFATSIAFQYLVWIFAKRNFISRCEFLLCVCSLFLVLKNNLNKIVHDCKYLWHFSRVCYYFSVFLML